MGDRELFTQENVRIYYVRHNDTIYLDFISNDGEWGKGITTRVLTTFIENLSNEIKYVTGISVQEGGEKIMQKMGMNFYGFRNVSSNISKNQRLLFPFYAKNLKTKETIPDMENSAKKNLIYFGPDKQEREITPDTILYRYSTAPPRKYRQEPYLIINNFSPISEVYCSLLMKNQIKD